MDDTEDDDTMSSSSTATSSDFSIAQDAQEETADTSQVNDFVDNLYEKRQLYFSLSSLELFHSLSLCYSA
jgi:hypothetical protein